MNLARRGEGGGSFHLSRVIPFVTGLSSDNIIPGESNEESRLI